MKKIFLSALLVLTALTGAKAALPSKVVKLTSVHLFVDENFKS